MSFPTVIAENGGNSTTNQTSVTVKLPDGSNVAGRLLLCFFTSDGSGETFTFPSDFPWTSLMADGGTGFTNCVRFRRTTGTEGYPATGATITVTVSSIEMSAHTTYLISGHHASTDPAASTPTTGTSVSPDPGDLNPGGWDVEDTLWFTFCSLNGKSSTTPRVSAYPTNYTTNGRSDFAANSNGVTQGVSWRTNAAASEDVGTFTSDTLTEWRAVTIAIRPAPGGFTVTANQVTETDTAQPVGKLKNRAIGQNTETETPQAIVKAKRLAIAQNTETDSAQAIGKIKVVVMAQVTETGLAQPITRSGITVPVGQVAETDVPQSIAARKSLMISQPTETSSVQAISAMKRLAVAQIAEADSASSIGEAKQVSLGLASETDALQIITSQKIKGIGQVEQADLAQPLGTQQIIAVGLVFETETAQTISRIKNKGTGVAIESEEVQSITAQRVYVVGIVIESNASQSLATRKTIELGQVGEIDAALGLGMQQTISVGLATELEQNTTISHVKIYTLTQASETNIVLVIDRVKRLAIAIGIETDIALLVALPLPVITYTGFQVNIEPGQINFAEFEIDYVKPKTGVFTGKPIVMDGYHTEEELSRLLLPTNEEG
jgi:hypothetical protein